MKPNRDPWRILPALLVAAVLRFAGLGDLGLTGDESYYWMWSQRLDYGYYDHPPGVALIVRLGTLLGGDTEFGARVVTALLGVATVALMARLGRTFGAGRAAAWLAVFAPPALVASRLAYPDGLLIFATLLSLSFFLDALHGQRQALIPFGLALGLALDAKYSALFFAAGLAIFVLVFRRDWLRERHVWIAAGVALALFAPVVVWNARHGFASFAWQAGRLASNPLGGMSAYAMLRATVAYLSWPVALAALLGLAGGALTWRRPASRALVLASLATVGPLALSRLDSPRNLVAGLLPLFALASAGPQRFTRWSRVAVVVLVVLIGVYGIGTTAFLWTGTDAPRSSVDAIALDTYGWRDLAPRLAASGHGILFTTAYSFAPQIAFYARQPAYTSWGQFQLWTIPEFSDATIVSLPYFREAEISAHMGEFFARSEGPLVVTRAERGVRQEVWIWYGYGLRRGHGEFIRAFDFLTLLKPTP